MLLLKLLSEEGDRMEGPCLLLEYPLAHGAPLHRMPTLGRIGIWGLFPRVPGSGVTARSRGWGGRWAVAGVIGGSN